MCLISMPQMTEAHVLMLLLRICAHLILNIQFMMVEIGS